MLFLPRLRGVITIVSKKAVKPECQTSQAVEDAIHAILTALNKIGVPSGARDLKQQAEVVARPPERDNIRTKILADKTY